MPPMPPPDQGSTPDLTGMPNPNYPPLQPTPDLPDPSPHAPGVSALDAHKTLVSLGLIVVVMVILVELAGASKDAHAVVTLLLLGVVLLLGVTYAGRFQAFSQQYPWLP